MNNEMSSGSGARGRSREASEWLVRLDSTEPLSDNDLEEWDRWTADVGNNAEFDAMVRMRRELSFLARPSLPTMEELLADGGDAEKKPSIAGRLRADRHAVVGRLGGRNRWATITIAAAAAAVVAFVVALQVSRWYSRSINPMEQVYATAPSEQRQVTLEDGSLVTLAADSAIVVRFANRARSVTLSQGEALFEVERDPSRPFTVLAGSGKITALGTAFDVRRYASRVNVTVMEGSVEVSPRGSSQDEPSPNAGPAPKANARWAAVRVLHGHEMTYDSRGSASAAKPTDAQLATAWTRGSLIYYGRPLREVIEDVQRYSARRILLDPVAGDLQYTGTVLQQSIDDWIRRLPAIFPVDVVDSASDRVVIRARTPIEPVRFVTPVRQ